MDSPIPTSFIPKRPVVPDTSMYEHARSRSVGLLSLITFVIVVATVVSFVGVYLYEKGLVSQREKLIQSLETARNGIGTDFVADMKRLTARIAGVKVLIQNHIVVTPIFEALEATTLRSVQYKTFAYEMRTDPATKAQVVSVTMTGLTKNYATIALQSDAFSQASIIKNPIFENLTVDDKTGGIIFELDFDVAPADLSFQTFVDRKAKENPLSPIIMETAVPAENASL